MTPRTFTRLLADTQLPSVFNPYSDCCPVSDKADAARVRRRNLVRCLESALKSEVDTIWIARDLGYRGGRRTGVPLTDEVHLTQAGHWMGNVTLERATRGPVMAERTAAMVWRVLGQIEKPAVLWNIFPLHPHDPDNPNSNRCHTRQERDATWPLLLALIDMIEPKRIVAIGRDASKALSSMDVPVREVRHPSYGGQADFIAGVHDIYGIKPSAEAVQTTLPLEGSLQ